MSKAENTGSTIAACRFGSDADSDFMIATEKNINSWMRIARSTRVISDQSQQIRGKARALRSLTFNESAQIELILQAQRLLQISEETADAEAGTNLAAKHALAQRLNSDARELIILCHYGHVEQEVQRRHYQLRSEANEQEAKEVLRQEAWAGINQSIDSYDPEMGASPLTYISTGAMRARMSRAIEREAGEAGVRLKADKTPLSQRINRAANSLEMRGERVSAETIAAELKLSSRAEIETIAKLLPWSHGQIGRLDAPLQGNPEDDSGATLGDQINDEAPGFEEQVSSNEQAARLRRAIEDIDSAFRRTVLKIHYGIDREPASKRDQFDGVYVDKQGKEYATNNEIINERCRAGIKVSKLAQSDLNAGFASGKLGFRPGTPESRELALLGRGRKFDRKASYQPVLYRDQALPPTPGSLAEARRRAEIELRKNVRLEAIAPDSYLGPEQLENSESAREQVRGELVKIGALPADVPRKYFSANGVAKTALRQLAEEHLLVDVETGRLNSARLAPSAPARKPRATV